MFGAPYFIVDGEPFFGGKPKPAGAGFYPADLTKEEFDRYLAAHPDEAEALTDPYTVVKRDRDRLVAVPYSVEYRKWLEPAAKLLEQAAARTSNASLKKFLTLRAQAFRTDDYFQSELAWMDLSGTPIEIAIGPYEVYTDTLYGRKTAFESFLTLKDPKESAALDVYKGELRGMEANLPVEERYKNFQRGFESPIVVADQIKGGGDNVPGIQTVAFNLPNDERVREAKGAKKVILRNVLGAKYERILKPMASLVLTSDQAGDVTQRYMFMETLFHELSHSLGPGTIRVNGRETTVDKELKEIASGFEEAKADVMGAYNALHMMDKGVLPNSERAQMRATYVAGLFRAMRFGIQEAHGKGAAMQYGYLRNKGALVWDEQAKRFRIDETRIDGAIRDSETIGAGDFPVYARGVAHRGPYKDGPGAINVPVAIDGMVVLPGDLLVGDADGLLAIRADEAPAIAARVRATTISPEVSLSSRCTMPARGSDAGAGVAMQQAIEHRAAQLPAAGCTTSPAGLLITSSVSSS